MPSRYSIDRAGNTLIEQTAKYLLVRDPQGVFWHAPQKADDRITTIRHFYHVLTAYLAGKASKFEKCPEKTNLTQAHILCLAIYGRIRTEHTRGPHKRTDGEKRRAPVRPKRIDEATQVRVEGRASIIGRLHDSVELVPAHHADELLACAKDYVAMIESDLSKGNTIVHAETLTRYKRNLLAIHIFEASVQPQKA